MTQQQAAEAVGIKRSALGAYEEGRAEPRLAVLAGLARLYGIGLDALVSGADDAGARVHGVPGCRAREYRGNGHYGTEYIPAGTR